MLTYFSGQLYDLLLEGSLLSQELTLLHRKYVPQLHLLLLVGILDDLKSCAVTGAPFQQLHERPPEAINDPLLGVLTSLGEG